MARKISEIYDRLNVAKTTFQELHDYYVDSQNTYTVQDTWETLLADISSASKVAIWRLMFWVFSVGSWIIETLFDVHKTEITALLASKKPHTLRWYAEESKKYQHGYGMIWSDDQYAYSRIDEDAKIIKYAAASEANAKVYLKVAKEVSGVKQPLSVSEKAAFVDFWAHWKDAGVKLEIVSLSADILKLDLTIIRDRLVLNGDNSLIRDSSIFPVADAIKAYGQALEFDGILRLSALVDQIQKAEGVVDVKLNHAYHKPAGGTFTEVDMSVVSDAGYFTIAQESTYEYIDNIIVSLE